MQLPSERIVAFLRALLAPPPAVPPRVVPIDGKKRKRLPRHEAPTRVDRVIAFVAALVCVLFAASLRDVASAFGGLAIDLAPAKVAPVGDAKVDVHVHDGDDADAAGAVVRAFAIVGDEVFFAGEGRTDSAGRASFASLPAGETWIVAYGEHRARASTRLFLEASSSAPRQVDLVLREATLFEVRVVDVADHPVVGLDVKTLTTDPLAHVARTGDDGIARFERLPPAPYTVNVAAQGYEPITRASVFPGREPLTIKLLKLGGFDVRVEDPDGAPAEGATVLISGPGLWPARSATTGEDGIAVITGLAAGVYDIKARQGGLVSRTDLSIPLRRGETVDRTVRLESGRSVSVRVVDASSRGDVPDPVDKAHVVVSEEGLSAFPLEATTDAKGEAVLGPVVEPDATVSVRAEGFVPRSVAATPGDDGFVEVLVERGGTISGDVVDARGFPIDGATIEIIGTDRDGMPIDETADRSKFSDDLFAFNLAGPQPLIPRGELGVMPGPVPDIPRAGATASHTGGESDPWVTRIDGTFSASPVTPGRVHVLVRHPSYIEETSDVVTLGPGGEQKVHIVMGEGGRLEGRVLEEDRTPVSGARIEVAAAVGTFETTTYAADDGTFALAAVPGDVVVTVYRPEDPTGVAARIEVDVPSRRTREIEIVLEKARDPVRIRVVDDRDYPIVRAQVRVTSLDAQTALERTLFTDDDGFTELTGARGLPLRVVLEHPGHAPAAIVVDPADKEHRFTMKNGLVARGSVTARAGRDRLEGADVTLYTETGARHARTDAEGSFEVKDLAEGRIRAVARADAHAEASLVFYLEGDGRRPIDVPTIDLSPAGEAEGTVTDGNDDAVAGARVAMNASPTYLPVGRLPRSIAVTDKEGRFTLGGLPEGKVVLEAYSPDLGRGTSNEIEIRGDRTTDRVKIEIPDQGYSARKPKGAGSVAVTLADRDGRVVVIDVPEGSEAEYAGVEPEDIILSVRGTPVRSIEEARDRLSGPLSEDVVVELSRQGKAEAATVRLRLRRETVRR